VCIKNYTLTIMTSSLALEDGKTTLEHVGQFTREDGKTTLEHVGQFILQCGEVSTNDALKLKMFYLALLLLGLLH
jgi:hypothetical protein